ncbi:MAG: hypothetical protein D6689_17655 [Deltaproteobacteria bacterium]|nr:MAG: hypothetical protein D6689_17655 [Deltaproteobacteria bacterium]
MPKLSPHALCITDDPSLRRTLKRSLHAAGSTVEFRSARGTGQFEPPPSIVIVDQQARAEVDLPALLDEAGGCGDIICLGASLEDNDVVELLRHTGLDHIISDVGKNSSGDDDELVVTSVKLLSGDIFGLEKYLAWGVRVHELSIDSYEQKRIALLTVAEQARSVGARRQLVAKIESVTDELLMNAMYDAPAIARGETPRVPSADEVDAGAAIASPALLRYACDGRYFAVSVEDAFGQLHKEAIVDHLLRARTERGRPRPTGGGGAGLGLYFVLSSVTRFVANVDPGRRTEVVCLFDLRQSGREADACTRSLHVFHTDRDDASPTDDEPTRPGVLKT